jgi:SAM-dependent methyltransferase
MNAEYRRQWLADVLGRFVAGETILDAGAGELQNRRWCSHLVYTSQDVCQYNGKGNETGLQTGQWDTTAVDLVCDILDLPEDRFFDVVLCSEVLEHTVDPVRIVEKLGRLVRPGGHLVLTAPFASLVHFAPHYYCTGFSRYWYEYHLARIGFGIVELTPNGGWLGQLRQELIRLPSMLRKRGHWHTFWAYPLAIPLALILTVLVRSRDESEVACHGWQCVAQRVPD